MARKGRVEIEGGLYHLITRGNDRQTIFHCDEDHAKFLSLLSAQKERLPFFLYAFCLMSNHVHLLIERKADTIGRIMHRLLTGYSQYYNRRYKKTGHLLQGRHKSILCQSEVYLGELVRYIHLNPVRAKMVEKAEDYPYSSQRAYLGIEPQGIVDVDPVLRLFGVKREIAQKHFAQYVLAGMKQGRREEFYPVEDGQILGSEEFVDATIHSISDTGRAQRPTDGRLKVEPGKFNAEALIAAVEMVFGVSIETICGSAKSARVIAAKEMLIVAGRRLGATTSQLSEITGIDSSNVSRRFDAAARRLRPQRELYDPVERIVAAYNENEGKNSAISQA